MKRLVLLGEGHGEVHALPILVGKLLGEKDPGHTLIVDKDVIRFASSRVMRPDKTRQQPDYNEWIRGVTIAARRSNTGAVLAVYDGDLKFFPPAPTRRSVLPRLPNRWQLLQLERVQVETFPCR